MDEFSIALFLSFFTTTILIANGLGGTAALASEEPQSFRGLATKTPAAFLAGHNVLYMEAAGVFVAKPRFYSDELYG